MAETSTTIIDIAVKARVGADLLDQARAAGLPEPYGITAVTHYDGVQLGFTSRDDVHAWAAWLGTGDDEYVTYLNGKDVTFTKATTVREGVAVELATNSRAEHVHRPTPDTYKQVDAMVSTADCVCGFRLISSHEGWVVA